MTPLLLEIGDFNMVFTGKYKKDIQTLTFFMGPRYMHDMPPLPSPSYFTGLEAFQWRASHPLISPLPQKGKMDTKKLTYCRLS